MSALQAVLGAAAAAAAAAAGGGGGGRAPVWLPYGVATPPPTAGAAAFQVPPTPRPGPSSSRSPDFAPPGPPPRSQPPPLVPVHADDSDEAPLNLSTTPRGRES